MCKKTLFLLMAAVVVLGLVGNASALITEQRDSADFSEKWEGDTNPPTGYTLSGVLDVSTDGDIFTMFCEPDTPKYGIYTSDNWTNSTALDANGWTLEIRLKLDTDYPDDPHFQFVIRDEAGANHIYRFEPDKIYDYGGTIQIDVDLTDDFHTFRLAEAANSGKVEIYLDNERIGEVNPFNTTADALFHWGSGSAALYGTTFIDYVRVDYSGGYRQKFYKATDPSPATGDDHISLNPTLTWTAGEDSASHDVYFGDTNNPTFIQNQPGTSYSPATLIPDTNYYWRIDEVNGAFTQTGSLWTFKTSPLEAAQFFPANYQINVSMDSTMTWSAGARATSYDVYFGNSYPPAFIGNQPGTSYTPSSDLDSETMYFWRIDAVDGSSSWTGDALRFTTIDHFRTDIAGENITATAMSEYVTGLVPPLVQAAQGVVNGNGMDESGLLHTNQIYSGYTSYQWFSKSSPFDQNDTNPAGVSGPAWFAVEFDKVYTLENMWLWNGNYPTALVLLRDFKTTQIHYSTDGNTWYQLLDGSDPNFIFAKATGGDDYAHDDYSNSPSGDNEVSFGGVEAKYVVLTCLENWSVGTATPTSFYLLAEVRFFATVEWASRPDPYDGATNILPGQALSWYPGEGATSHNVYFGTTNPPPFAQSQSGTTFTPSLSLGNTYYWRVDEVSVSGTTAGQIWSFEINNYLLVDDMEAYAANPIYNIWNDGYVNYSGSWIDTTTLVTYNGEVAMDFAYDNRASYDGYSEVDASITAIGSPTDWTQEGIKALTLYFYGNKNNDANETMYVALKDGDSARGLFEVRYGDKANEDMNDIKRGKWQEWNIDLAEFAAAGINLANVERIYIGFDDSDAANRGSTAGGTGTVYFDDISVYLPRCILDYTLGGDIAGPDGKPDCVVDKWDLRQMIADWMLEDSYVYTVEPDTTGLVGYWRLDEGEGTAVPDSSTYGNHGTLLNGTPWTSDAVYLNALDFDGIDDHVFIDDDSGAVPWEFSTESFSISLWIKTDNAGLGVILVNGTSVNPPDSGKRYEISRAGGLYFAVDDDDTKSDLSAQIADVFTGEWVHIVAIRDTGLDELRIYADGVQNGDAVEDKTGDISSPGESLYFASVWDAGTYYYDGKLDDVRIYNRVLTDPQITEIAEKGEPTGTVLVYRPLTELSEISETEAVGSKIINFMDYSLMADDWEASGLWPR